MADLYASRAPVRLNDGTADANNAVIVNAAPSSGDYALAVRQVGIAAAAALADATANPTVVMAGSPLLGFNGTTWDRLRSDITNGLDVDVTRVTGTVTVGQATASALNAQVVGSVALDAAAAAINPVLVGTYASAAAPADVSADGDAVRLWALRNGSQVVNMASGGTLITVGSKTSAASFPVVIASDQGAIAVTPAANSAINLAQVGGTAVVTGGVNGTQGVAGIAAHDAAFTNVNPLLAGAGASAAAPTDVNADGDLVRLWALRNGSLVVNTAAGGTLLTNIGQAAGTSKFVRINDGTTTAGVIVGTTALKTDFSSVVGAVPSATNPIPARLTDGTAFWTRMGQTQATSPYGIVSDGTNFATVRDLAANDALNVAIVDGSGAHITSFGGGTQYVGDAAATATPTGTISMGLANAAAPTDVTANNDAVAQWMLRNGSAVVNLASGGTLITLGSKVSASSLPVVIASDQGAVAVSGSVTADTELPVAAVLADAAGNPTVPAVGGFLMGFNGTTWDRVRTANTGRLQVDVVSGGGAPAPSEIPSGYNMIDAYGTAAAVAAGATSTAVVTNTPAGTKATYIKQVLIAASGQTKWQLKFGATVKATGFQSQNDLSGIYRFDPPIPVTGDGTTAITVDITNRELSAMDVYARLNAIVQQ